MISWWRGGGGRGACRTTIFRPLFLSPSHLPSPFPSLFLFLSFCVFSLGWEDLFFGIRLGCACSYTTYKFFLLFFFSSSFLFLFFFSFSSSSFFLLQTFFFFSSFFIFLFLHHFHTRQAIPTKYEHKLLRSSQNTFHLTTLKAFSFVLNMSLTKCRFDESILSDIKVLLDFWLSSH